jgi:hypothetical protein
MIDGAILVIVGLVLAPLMAVRFQNLVSFADAPVGSNAAMKIIRAVTLAMLYSSWDAMASSLVLALQ